MKKCPKCNKLCESGETRFCNSCGSELFFIDRFEKENGKILTIYFSATGNTKFIAELFSRNIGAKCFSIEDNADFINEIKAHDTIAVCYPIYGSRVPLILREFVARYMNAFEGKKLAIFVTQLAGSGDGARVFCDLFSPGHVEVIYAEHFFMPNNVCNFALLWKTSDWSTRIRLKMAEKKMNRVCQNINSGVIKKRGFSLLSRLMGKIQGIPWQGDSKNPHASPGTMEYKAMHSVKIDASCTVCGICVTRCPMKNLEPQNDIIGHKNNCTICYRCINLCPHKAITVFFHKKPKWQYEGLSIGEKSSQQC